MILLFRQHPEYRDKRWLAIEKIITDNYMPLWGKSILSDCKLAYDIDRMFRLIQQKIPELRGKEWLKRQRMGGVASSEVFSDREQKNVTNAYVQMQIQFREQEASFKKYNVLQSALSAYIRQGDVRKKGVKLIYNGYTFRELARMLWIDIRDNDYSIAYIRGSFDEIIKKRLKLIR